MADRKKNGTRTQTAELKNREKRVPTTTKEGIKSTPAPARTEKSVSTTEEEFGATPAPARVEDSASTTKEKIGSTPAPARTEKNASTAKEKIGLTPARTEKSTKVASTREARREPVKQETKSSARRDAPSTFTRLRNGKAGRFVYDAYYELRYKVNWPTFEEARNMAILVVVISAALGLLIAGTDFGLYRLFQLITTGK